MSKQTNRVLRHIDQLAECHGDLLPDLDQSMWEMFHSTATKYPQRDAIVSLWQPNTHLNNLVGSKNQSNLEPENSTESDCVLRLNYEELLRSVELLAGWLQSQGCAEGQNLVSMQTNILSRYKISSLLGPWSDVTLETVS